MRLKPTTLAMVLAGGRVDELHVLTRYRPKSAVPFGGFARIIDFTLSNLMWSGLERAAILAQYRSFSLINHIGTGGAWDMVGRYRGLSVLPPSTGYGANNWYRGSADAVFQNFDFIDYHDPREVLILSGDHVYHMDYRDLLAYHREKDADLTIACLRVPVTEAHRFGLAEIDEEDGERGGRVVRYKEKPARPTFYWASMTVFCFKPAVLREVLEANAAEDDSHEFGRDIIPRLMYAGRKIYGYKFYGYWGYTRTLEEYWQANMDLLGPDPKLKMEEWGIRTNLEHRHIRDSQPLKIGSQASVQNSLVYNGCTVEGTVENSILFPGVRIEKGALVKDSVLLFNNVVGRDCRFHKVVSDVNNTFGRGVRVGEEGPTAYQEVSVIGWNNIIAEETVIGSDCMLYPNLKPGKLAKVVKTGETVR